MSIISIVTATHNKRWRYYEEAAESVFSQIVPKGWKLEWLIQVDGVDKDVHETLERLHNADDRVILRQNHAQLGPGGTRNVALMRARGELLRVFDSDDVMLPDTLAAQIEIFQKYPDVHWSTYQPIELHQDGTKAEDPPRLKHKYIEPGLFNKVMFEKGRCPVHCAGLMARTDTIRAFGGWLGLPVGEDVGMLSALSEMYGGWVMEEYGWLYRRHKGQITNNMPAKSWDTMGEDVSEQRLHAMKKLGWKKA